ncbi:MAG TPA: family 78 glycoside hydrolase catalytic domain [Bryobacteraceae bacterium]|jgi:hypothetical protein
MLASAADLSPYRLECEARADPLGVDSAHPRISWKLKSDRQGDRQIAYQILAASTRAKLDSDVGDLWSTERVASQETTWIPYDGAPLHSFQHVWWKVRVWSVTGAVSTWSEAAQWTMALVDPADRKGNWIAPASYALRSGPMPLFRHEVTLDRSLGRVIVLISGLGFHELRINGAKVGDNVLAPAWTNYRDTVLYESYDVTPLLKAGPNAFAVMLGNGFYNVVGGRYSKYTGSFGVPRLWLQLHVEFSDGHAMDAGTDGSWRVHDGPITFSDIYGGEDFDARLEPVGWDRPGFDDSGWTHASGVEAPGGILTSDISPPARVMQMFDPVRVTQPKPNVFVYDLGQNFAGWPRITVSGPAGAQVRLECGELLDSSGLVSQASSGGPNYFTYTLRGSDRETWSPRFSYYGFRYVAVAGARPESAPAAPNVPILHRLQGQFVYLDVENTGRFSSSNDLLNRIHALIGAAIKSNLQHVLTDCPHREKLGWLEQTYLMGPSLLYNWDLRTFLPKMIRDIREAQTIDGQIPGIAPEYVEFSGGFRDSPEWGSAAIMLPWLAWQWYGDRQPLASSYRTMTSYNTYLRSKAKDGLLLFGLGDWYDIAPGPPGPSKLTPLGLTGTATWIRDLQILGQAARLLGRDDDAKTFGAELASEAAAFQKAFSRPRESSYATGSQTALAMPSVIGLAPASASTALISNLIADIRRAGNHTTAGDIGYRYVIEALLNAGRSDVIYDMAVQTTAPSYAAQLAAGATSLTEAWDADPNSSQNHLMLGHIDEWFFAGLAGVRPDNNSPGLRHIVIHPQPLGDLKDVSAFWNALRGPVSVTWHADQGSFQMNLELPPGMSADVYLPDGSKTQVESGRYRFDVPLGHAN